MKYLAKETAEIARQNIVLADETAVYMEDPKRSTLDQKGSRHVAMETTGFASMRVTSLVATTVSGKMFPPLIIFKNKKINKGQETIGAF